MLFLQPAAAQQQEPESHFGLSLVPFLWRLIRSHRPARTRRDLGRSIEFVLRLLPFLPWVIRVKKLFSDPRLQPLLLAQPAMLDKLRRPYQDRRLGVSARLRIIDEHYHWLLEQYSPAALQALYQPGGQVLGEFSGQQKHYFLRLQFDRLFDKEGELMLTLFTAAGQQVATLAFCITGNGAAHVMRIGGLQGDKEAGQELFKAITKDCHGLRPLALLVNIAQLLAMAWGMKEVQAISSGEHIYQHWRYRYKKIHQVARNYDELWQELGGTAGDGWYQLPLPPQERDPAEAPSHKRAMYRRRQQLLVGLREGVGRYVVSQR
jgi:uncharacterized protein VirK/YbjX